jgi:hypothetical protein
MIKNISRYHLDWNYSTILRNILIVLLSSKKARYIGSNVIPTYFFGFPRFCPGIQSVGKRDSRSQKSEIKIRNQKSEFTPKKRQAEMEIYRQ